MLIEYLDKQRNAFQTRSVGELPKDLSGIARLQITDYTKEDIISLENLYGIDAEILQNSDDIEISSHYLEKETQLAFNFSYPYLIPPNKLEEEIISFILKEDVVFFFMASNFEQLIARIQKKRQADIKSMSLTVNGFLMVMIKNVPDYFADLTEIIAKNTKAIYAGFEKQQDFKEEDLTNLTALKFNNSVIRESLNEFSRILHLLKKSNKVNAETREEIYLELADIKVVNEHIQNNFDRLDDLKEYVSNKIDLEQNRIFKTLTIITTCISLPTLVAGIYGMNFKFMPELDWKYGYVYAIAFLIICLMAA